MKRLPKHLTGPFVNGYYDYKKATIYLKNEAGEWTSTLAYPSFFIDSKNENRFPSDDYGKYIIDRKTEGQFIRMTRDPQMDRDVLRDMIYECKDAGVVLYEADANPVRRWFSDTGALVAQKFSNLYFDLETDPLVIGFDDKAKRSHRVISFAAYDDAGNSWFYAAHESSEKEEEKLLRQFIRVIQDYDVLLAWNGDAYDFFVLRARMKRHGIRLDWRAWCWLDHMLVVKKVLMSISDSDFKRSFALDSIGENVLGIRKIKLSVPSGQMKLLLGERQAELEEYNRRDVEIMLQLEQRKEYLALHYMVCSMCRTFPNHGSIYPNELADGILMRLAIQEGKHFPTRDVWAERSDDKKKYEGAFVMDPVIGFHTNVQVPDFASLYPSIILSWNMSNETILDPDNLPDDFTGETAHATATNTHFRNDVEGIIPRALKRLITKRNEYKARAKNYPIGSEEYKNMTNLSTAVKVVTNSFYGLLGNEGSRFYNKDIARSITLTGQLLIRQVAQYFEHKGLKTIYGDSVTSERTTCIRRNKQVDVVTFEELWNEYSRDSHQFRGKEVIYNPPVETISRSTSGCSEWKPIARIIRHKTNKKIYRITNPYGEVRVTEDHSIQSDRGCVTPAQMIKENIPFQTIDVPNRWINQDKIDLYATVENKKLVLPYKNRTIIYQFVLSPDKEHFYLEGWKRGPIRLIDRYIYLDDKERVLSFLRILGAYITKGSSSIRGVTSTRWMFSIAQNKPGWLKTREEDFKLLFPSCPISHPFPSDSKGSYVIRSGNSTVVLLFAWMAGYKSTGKFIPQFIYDLPSSHLLYFIYELVDGDGSINKKNGEFSYTTKSQKLIAGLSYIMNVLQFECSYSYRPSKESWDISTFTHRRNTWLHKTHVDIQQADDEWVYDLEVADNHTFVDGIGRVVLHNTDSIFVKCSEEEMTNEIKYINSQFIPHMLRAVGCKDKDITVKLEYDKGFATLLLITKKRYVGRLSLAKGRRVSSDIEPEVKGLETQRSDQLRYGQELLRVFMKLLIEEGTNPSTIDQMLRDEADQFFIRKLTVHELEIAESVKGHPDTYTIPTVAAKVARQMIEEGMEFFPGIKIPYIVLEHKPTIRAIHSSKFDGTCDRVYYWENRILPPIKRLLDVRFPDYPFNNFTNPGQMIIDFDRPTIERRKVRVPTMPKRTIRKPNNKRRRIPRANITIPSTERTELIIQLARLLEQYPGEMPLTLHVDTGDALVTIHTEEKISSDGLKEISRLFSALIISPRPI